VLLAAVNHDPASCSEVYPVHHVGAGWTFDIGGNTAARLPGQFEQLQAASVYLENILDGLFQQGFKFARIKEEAKALFAALYEKLSANAKIDSPEVSSADRADSFCVGFVGGIVVNPFQVNIITAAAVIAADSVQGDRGRTVGAVRHLKSPDQLTGVAAAN